MPSGGALCARVWGPLQPANEGIQGKPLAEQAFLEWPRICRGQPSRLHLPENIFVSRTPYDEMQSPEGRVRPHYEAFAGWLARTPPARIAHKREEAERAFHPV